MKRLIKALVLLVLIIGPVTAIAAPATVIPTFSITAVSEDISVTIQTSNFPASDNFTVTMGAYGTLGIGGTVVGTQASGGGGSFTATYTIPASLHGSAKIAIRLQSPTSGYYAYNWFYNNDAPGPPPPPSAGWPPAGPGTIPWTNITAVNKDVDVTANGGNFTTNDTYNVYIGAYGTLGVGGTSVGTQTTNASGTFTATYPIPAVYAGSYRLAIRWESTTTGYYAYDWFVNDSSAVPAPPAVPPAGPGTIPWTNITAVNKDVDVTANGGNFPANDTLSVYIGAYGTLGVGGTSVGTQTTNANGKFTGGTYTIPAAYAGSYRLAIRWKSTTSAYYAYDWFVNDASAAPAIPPAGSGTIPWTNITAVNKDVDVTTKGGNFPANDTLNVYIGAYGTLGVGGTYVGTQTTNANGKFTGGTYTIPAAFIGSTRLAIRWESTTSAYYAYDWFNNANYP